ncbi:MAG: phosphatase PAP2 family protein [Clostridia bacterium]|nr:phosphatase PAP2 family protein [Clostridia bacterium]
MDKDIMTFDETGYSIVSKYLITDTLTPIAKIITFFGSAYWLIGLSIFLLLIIKNKKIGISISINLGLAALTNFLLKQILQRPRPIGHRIIDESGYSLPSGHSMVSMAFYGFLIYLVYKRIENKHLKSFLIALLFVLIINIGISRIYLGVHYTSDVIAGFLVAISYLIIYANTIKSLILEDKK